MNKEEFIKLPLLDKLTIALKEAERRGDQEKVSYFQQRIRKIEQESFVEKMDLNELVEQEETIPPISPPPAPAPSPPTITPEPLQEPEPEPVKEKTFDDLLNEISSKIESIENEKELQTMLKDVWALHNKLNDRTQELRDMISAKIDKIREQKNH